ncbi:GspE/PulE family protein [Microvirga sp. G4-2]|uniref:GspE/PulE family protein n=1 Tax=Microvirga sp. G4-2 TaxID=3434467 RepID=UPI0040442336
MDGVVLQSNDKPSLPSVSSPRAAIEAVIDVLVQRSALTLQSLTRGQRASEQSRERLDLVLNKLGIVSDSELALAWSTVTGLTIAEPGEYPNEVLLRETLSDAFLRHAKVIPLRVHNSSLELAVVDALDLFTPAAIAAKTGLEVSCRIARHGEFAAAFERLYGRMEGLEGQESPLITSDHALTADIERLRDQASDAPVVRIVNNLIDRAIELGASDLHISATRTGSRIRYRIDGILRDVTPPTAEFHAAVVSRLKIMAGLDIAERRLPQDGRIRIAWRGREIDLRLATIPHMNGEGAVLRVLDRSAVALDFHALGFSAPVVENINSVLKHPHGIFLVTGPTGSGKTTTLYAALQTIAEPQRNIITVEDPIEYQLEGVNQIQVNRKIGLDFASTLRAVLRHDPDVIMVGEIRDRETAVVANQAALTGHLVLATIHTNTAVAALPRLVDMGIEPYLLASTIRASMAQRLVRRLCPHCRKPEEAGSWQRHIWKHQAAPPEVSFRATGCEACQHTGYAGRLALAEVAIICDNVREALLDKADETWLAAAARSAGMRSLLDDGLSKVASAQTSMEEVLRVTGASS